jgi:hypothetical protein
MEAAWRRTLADLENYVAHPEQASAQAPERGGEQPRVAS